MPSSFFVLEHTFLGEHNSRIMIFQIDSVWEKIELCEQACHQALVGSLPEVPPEPARDVEILRAGNLPSKKGLSFLEGQARLLHDLASIELQAMELGLRTLCEFPEAPSQFREELAVLTISESRHLKLCLESLEKLGFSWGDWPAHLALWQATAPQDSLLDRVCIVHRYLEGSGLDAGEAFLRKLSAVSEGIIHRVVKQILEEEIEHVEFGSRWYRKICANAGFNPEVDFFTRMEGIRHRVPKRVERISKTLRMKAGFSEVEIAYLEELRTSIVCRTT